LLGRGAPQLEHPRGLANVLKAEKMEQIVFTGERAIPDDPQCLPVYLEHLARYRFARGYVAGQRVLDIACGVGYGTSLLAEAGAVPAVGIEIDAASIAYAERRYGKTPNVRFVQASASRLVEVAPGPYDVCVSFETIEHLEDPEQFLRDVARVLTAQGLLIISTPNRYLYCPENYDGLRPRNPFHRREWTVQEFLRLLSQQFDVLSVHGQLLLSPRHAALRRWKVFACRRVAGTWLEGPVHGVARLRRLPLLRAAYQKCHLLFCGRIDDGRPAAGDREEETRALETEEHSVAVRSVPGESAVPTYIVCLCRKRADASAAVASPARETLACQAVRYSE